MASALSARGGGYDLLIRGARPASTQPRGEAMGLRQQKRCGFANKGYLMNLPKIDLSTLPDLDLLTGLFGSLADAARVQTSDDTIVILMTFLYELNPTGGMF
jgi:hypothetical protein